MRDNASGYYSSSMFFFERDVSGRLILAARKHLPDISKAPSLLNFLKGSQFQLRNVVLAMVRRGDFDDAVRKLTDILISIATDHRYEFAGKDSVELLLAIDSLIVVMEALLTAFTEHMVSLQILSKTDTEMLVPYCNMFCCIELWSPATRLPPLDPTLAKDILSFATRVMPPCVVGLPLSTSLLESQQYRLSDMLLSAIQYVSMTNPMLVHEATAMALTEWDPPARIDLLLVSPNDSEGFERYLHLARSYLPRLDSNDQPILMKLVYVGMMRALLARPSCSWAVGARSISAIDGFITAVERSRSFRALRAFRSEEALVIAVMELIKFKALAASPPTRKQTDGRSSSPSKSHQSSNASSSNVSAPTKTPSFSSTTSTRTDATSEDESARYNSSGIDFAYQNHYYYYTHTHHPNHHPRRHSNSSKLSVAHLKIFERSISLVKRENPADKRVASRLAAIEFLISIGFLGWSICERPGGYEFKGLVLDILPYTPMFVEEFDNLNDQYKILCLTLLSQVNAQEFDKLAPRMTCLWTLQLLRTLLVLAKPVNLSKVLNKCSTSFCEFLHHRLDHNQCNAVEAPLNILLSLPSNLVPFTIVEDCLSHLSSHLAKNYEMSKNTWELLENYISILVKRVGTDQCLKSLSPLIPHESPVDILRHPMRLKTLHLLLKILAHDDRIVPMHYLEGNGILANKAPALRTTLLLCLCSDNSKAIEVALKCLELLQGDPDQSPAERDLVSELLDSMDQSLPSTTVMQKRMAATLAVDSDSSFLPFNELVRAALESLKEKPLSYKLHGNLLRARTATLALEPPAVRLSYYSDVVSLDGTLLQALSGSIPLDADLAREFFLATTHINERSLARVGPINNAQLSGKCQLYTWLLTCLELSHPISAGELRLGELCCRAVASLAPRAASNHEIIVLRLVRASVKYASSDDPGQTISVLFSQVVHMILARAWDPESSANLEKALGSIFHHFKEPDDSKLRHIVDQVLSMNLENIRISVLTPLLNENVDHLMQLYNLRSPLSDVYRASTYEALTQIYISHASKQSPSVESGDLVMFLLENRAVLRALSDVCTVNGDDGISVALVQLFQSHSKSAERRLVELAVNHEVASSNNASELFRSNSVTMKVLLEWLRSVSSNYLSGVLSPALASLRWASFRDEKDMENLFADAIARFKNKPLPVHLQWLLCLVREKIAPKFGTEVADQAVSVLMVLRFVCPAVVAPHHFGVARRPPARQFATILRKFAVYLQRRGKFVCESMAYIDGNKPASGAVKGGCSSTCTCANDYEAFFNGKENDHTVVYSEEQYTSATRQVYHFLQRHAVEVRVVLLSHGYGDIVAKMLRYFRIGRSSNYLTEQEHETPQKKYHDTFMGKRVAATAARDVCSETGISKYAVDQLATLKEPIVIDFTDFYGLFDRWAEFMLYIAYSGINMFPQGFEFYSLNCPQRTKAVMKRLEELISLPLEMKFLTSADFDDVQELPSNLPDIRSAVIDLRNAVKFTAQVRLGLTVGPHEASVYVGAKYLQIITNGACDVISYVSKSGTQSELVVKLSRNELQISIFGSDCTIYSPSSSLIRVLELSLKAANAENLGATVELSSPGDIPSRLKASEKEDQGDVKSVDGFLNNAMTHDVSHQRLEGHGPSYIVLNAICPGKLLFLALYDSMHDSAEVRRRALELYAVLPDSLGLQLNIPSPQETLMPNQVIALAAAAAKKNPELALCVASGLAGLHNDITEKAALVASPWIPYLVVKTAEHRNLLRTRVLKPLLEAASAVPKTIGPILLEHFWPFLKDLPTLIADLLLETSMKATPESLNVLRQILSGGISSDRPYESREFAEALLARLYSLLRDNSDPTATKWSSHSEWHEIKVCTILFCSVAVDWRAAELLFPEVSFLLLVFAGVGPPQLRSANHQMLVNYLNAFLQSPNLSAAQRQRLQSSRAEITGPRGLVLFGVQQESESNGWVSDDYTEFTPEMSEHLGRILSDIYMSVFSDRLSIYQETRVAVAARVMEVIDINWPPLQRRCILGLMGAVRSFMPDSIVGSLIKQLSTVLAETGEATLPTRGVLVSTFLRMFGDTVECIPGTGIYHQCLFWLSVVSLASGCIAIQADAVRLLRQTIKIAHFRGSFREQSLAEVYLSVTPLWADQNGDEALGALPLDIPSTKENFHIALAQLLVLPFQQAESQRLALECCDVLATACPSEFVYAAFLYLGGEDGRIAARVPTGVFVDTDDAVSQWLASMVRHDDPSSVLALALCAEISGFSRSMSFSQTGPRLLDLMLCIKDRRVVNMISPLLRPIFLQLLKLDDRETEIGLNRWSLYIFSNSPEERTAIVLGKQALYELVNSLNLRPWFDNNYKIHPFFFENVFTETTRQALTNSKWTRTSHITAEPSSDGEKLF